MQSSAIMYDVTLCHVMICLYMIHSVTNLYIFISCSDGWLGCWSVGLRQPSSGLSKERAQSFLAFGSSGSHPFHTYLFARAIQVNKPQTVHTHWDPAHEGKTQACSLNKKQPNKQWQTQNTKAHKQWHPRSRRPPLYIFMCMCIYIYYTHMCVYIYIYIGIWALERWAALRRPETNMITVVPIL